MGAVFALVALACGVALVIKLDTGTLDAVQVTGIGLISLACAFFAGVSWPSVFHRGG